jgi:hypothetical protein
VHDGRLCAYVVATDGSQIDVASLRAHAAEYLPEYMVPSAIIRIASMPLTSSGKVDSKALPVPDKSAFAREAYVAPGRPEEVALAAMWKDLLGIDQVGVSEDFFALGGHSLLAIRLFSDIQRVFGVRVPLRQLFATPTIAGLATEIAARRGDSGGDLVERPQLVPTGERRSRLIPGQRGTYRLDQDAPTNRVNRENWCATLAGPLDVPALERALFALRERHAILRARFFEEDGELWQESLDEVPFPVLVRADLSALSESELPTAITDFENDLVQRAFDVGRGEVMRAALIATSKAHILLLSLHRLVSDDEALRVFVEELATLWRALTEDPNVDPSRVLATVPLQYHDLAVYLNRLRRSEAGQRQRNFWQEQLAGCRPLELPTTFSREHVEAVRDAKGGFASFPMGLVRDVLASEHVAVIDRVSRAEGATTQAALLAAMVSYLRRITGQQDIAMITHLIFRHLPGLAHAIGLFGNPLVLRVAGTETALGPLTAHCQEVITAAYENGEADVLRLASPKLFRLWFNYLYTHGHSAAPRELALPQGVTATPFRLASDSARRMAYDLLVIVAHEGDRVVFNLGFNRDLFDQATARQWLDDYIAEIIRLTEANGPAERTT